MKKIYLFVLIAFSVQLKAQIQDLASLAQGDLVAFNSLSKDNQLFGYFLLYDQGSASENTKNFEYYILDKNLNKVANKIFEAEKTVYKYTPILNFKDQIILNPKLSYYFGNKDIYPNSKIIDLKTNQISNRSTFCYENNVFIDCPENNSWKENKKDRKKEKKEKGFVYDANVYELKYGGFLVYDLEDYEDFSKNHNIIRFDQDKKELWRITFNQNATKKSYENYFTLSHDENNIYYLIKKVSLGQESYKIKVVGLDDGKVKLDKEIIELVDKSIQSIYSVSSQYSIENIENFDDKVVIVGKMEGVNKGYFRIIIDKNTFELKINSFSWKDDMTKFIEVDKNGGVGKGYNLELRDILFQKDGSVTLITEKFKLGTNVITGAYVPKNTDMVVIILEDKFKIKDVKVLEKTKSKYSFSDYLFHQSIDEKKDMVFFYKDYLKDDESKDKNWNLYINTIINGEFKQEQVQISSKEDKYYIYPFIAKEGFILLYEFNKKDKYTQIRLERLNY